MQQICKHIPATTNMQTTEELLDAMFSMRSCRMKYSIFSSSLNLLF
jgi:hypothetical protein